MKIAILGVGFLGEKIVDNSDWILKPPYDSSLNTSKITSIGIETTDFKIALKELKKLLLIYRY